MFTRTHARTHTGAHTHMQNEMQQQGPSVYMFNNTLSNIRHKLTATAFTVFILVITSQEDIHTAQPCTHTHTRNHAHTHKTAWHDRLPVQHHFDSECLVEGGVC